MKQHEISHIEKLFSAIRKLPDGNRYDEGFFKTRLSAVAHLVETRRRFESALVACYEEEDQLLQLPNAVNAAMGKHLYQVAVDMDFLTSSKLPYVEPAVSVDDDNETDVRLFTEMSSKFPHRPIAHSKDHPATAGRYLFVFIYVAANQPANLQKWRLHDAERLEVEAYRPHLHYVVPRTRKSWADFHVFNVNNGEYEAAGRDLDMNGRGRVLIFRKIGLEQADCPSLARREHWAIFSAKDKSIEAFPPSEAPSPLPPSSPPSSYNESDEVLAEEIKAPRAGARSPQHHEGASEHIINSRKRQLSAPAAVVAKKPKLAGPSAHNAGSSTFSYQDRIQAQGGKAESAIYITTSDPDCVSPHCSADHSSDLEIVAVAGPLFKSD